MLTCVDKRMKFKGEKMLISVTLKPEFMYLDYYAYLGNIHQLITLAHQINSDAANLPNHKYIAHQMVLLHVSKISFMTLD